MALDTTRIKVMELENVMVYEMTADAGSEPTYGTGILVPGTTKLGIKPEMVSAELEGEGTLLDVFSKMKSAEVSIDLAYLNMQLAAILTGVTVATTGTTPNQVTTMDVTKNSRPKWFKIEGRWMYPGLGLGSVNFTLYKCKATDPGAIEIEDANGDFGKPTVVAKVIPTISTGKIYSVAANETAALLTDQTS